MTIPNVLSILRILLVPVFCVVYFQDIPHANFWAAGIYALAALTDMLDGFIARRYNLITRMGRVLDPLADKMMNFAVLVSLIVKGLLPLWAAAIYFCKEIFMGIGTIVQFKRIDDVPPSNLLGKFSTVFFIASCLTIMLFPTMPFWLAVVLITTALGVTLAAFAVYIVQFSRNVGKSKGSKVK